MPDLVSHIDVSAWTLRGVETRGANEKSWLLDDSTGDRWLFKPRSKHSDGSNQIGDWVEWVASKVAEEIGLKTATIRLGQRGDELGCLSLNVLPNETWDMQTGRLWLDDRRDIDYSSAAATPSRRDKGASPGHTLQNIQRSLQGLDSPPGYDRLLSAWDVFVGYLVLDALTGNRDRHEENWAIMRPLRGSLALAPAYDMESGLGFQLRDPKRLTTLQDPGGIDRFARRGTATRFDGDQTTTLVDLAASAARSCSPEGSAWISGLIDAASTINFATLIRPAVGVSAVAVNFAQVLLGTNVRRMQDAYSA